MTDTATRSALDERLDALEAAAERGDTAAVRAEVARLREYLRPERLLPPAAVAARRGVATPLMIELLIAHGDIRGVQRDGQYLVPLREVERLRDDPKIRYLRELDRLHDLTAGFGNERMSEEELEVLAAGRSGTYPWQR